MRILAVAELYPWPAVDGYRQRLHHMLGGLASAGTLEVFTLVRDGHDPGPPELTGLGRVVTAPSGPPRPSSEWIGEWRRGEVPRRVLSIDWTEGRRELAAWGPSPDLVWYSHVHSWWPTNDLFEGVPSIVDFDNLENLAMQLRRRVPPRVPPGSPPVDLVRTGARWLGSRAVDLVDERRWDAIQRRCAAAVDRVVVCSDLDRERSGCGNAVVVPNGSSTVQDPRADRSTLMGEVPTMCFVGALGYEPNSEAVEWFVREVFPLVRARRPDAVLRVVGRGAERIAWVADVPGVELVGAVSDLRPELDAADVSVVPITVGAGTRLKVIEAMAHHIPLVTTTVGCEGVDLRDGEHALLADDPRRFADGCLRLFSDPALRQRLADAGADLFEADYTWSSIEERVAGLAAEVAGPGQD